MDKAQSARFNLSLWGCFIICSRPYSIYLRGTIDYGSCRSHARGKYSLVYVTPEKLIGSDMLYDLRRVCDAASTTSWSASNL